MTNNHKFYENYESIFSAWTVDLKYQRDVYMPNELFEIFLECESDKSIKATHIPLAYSFLYFQTWMYSHAMYGEKIPTIGEVKEILGYNKDDRRINSVIGEGKLLDELGLTAHCQDFPIAVVWEKEIGHKHSTPTIELLIECAPDNAIFLDMVKERGGSNTTTCKRPLYLFDRIDNDGEEIDGTLTNPYFTTRIEIDVFDFCMRHPKELGCTAFYIYCYLKHKNDLHRDGYDATPKRIAEEIGLSESTVKRVTARMRSHNLMNSESNMDCFSPNMPKELWKANTNTVNTFRSFSNEPVEYEKFGSKEAIEKRKAERAQERKEKELRKQIRQLTAESKPVEVVHTVKDNDGNTITIKDSDLPF